jgi:hypothetical protein
MSGFPSVDKFPYESYVKLRRHSKRCIVRSGKDVKILPFSSSFFVEPRAYGEAEF